MKTKRKALLLSLCAVLLVAASVLGTMAYLTSTDEVKNTFTVGQVKIKLDEAKVNTDGAAVTPAERVKENTYKLLPGHTYTKDPTVTVLKDSEESYVKMTVTLTKANALSKIIPPKDVIKIFNGYDGTTWLYKGEDWNPVADTAVYIFWYKKTVGAPTADVTLDALFDSITIPGTITGEQLATIEGMTITVNAYAIQADGFADAEAAWTAFGNQQ